MKDILAAPAPYGMIKDADTLIRAVEGVDAALVTKRRDHVLQRIEAHIAKVEAELDAAEAGADLRNQCLHPLQTLKRQVEGQPSIAHINQGQQNAREAEDKAFSEIEEASRQVRKDGVTETEHPV